VRKLLALVVLPLVAGCGASARYAASTATSPPPPPAPGVETAPRPAAPRPRPRPRTPAQIALGLPAVGPGPVPGYVLIADRNNNRLLLVSPAKRIVWRVTGLHDPDDAFFVPGWRRIVTNEEFNDSIAQIDIRTRRIVWNYGRAGVAGSAPGELSNPDDAYVLPNRDILVADIKNCRVLRLSPAGRILTSIGSPASCTHDPPRTLSSPNGVTPLADGGVLITEIGGWVDRLDAKGRLLYSVRTPTTYPSDAQLLPDGNVLVAGFDTPGRVDEITPAGRIVRTYGPSSGLGMLDRPSLAVRWPNGMIAVTDDWHHRVVVIDPRTNRIVWQYGHLGAPGSTNGYLSKPDGLQLLPARQTAAPARRLIRTRALSVVRIGRLPEAASRIAAAALPGGKVVVAGGLTAGGSATWVLAGTPAHLRLTGRLPQATHDAALAVLGGSAFLVGGGESVSVDQVIRVYPRVAAAGRIGEPLSDLGAASVGGTAYLVGGYTGTQYATAVLRFRPGRAATVVARLPSGLRYAGVAALGGRIYVAGGVTTAGDSSAVYAVDPAAGKVTRVATLPSPIAHAALGALGGRLYLVGGESGARPRSQVLAIDPGTGSVTTAGSLPGPHADPAAVTVGREIVVLGGAGAAPSDGC
jgi:outer membrane protein assembly factor BamB